MLFATSLSSYKGPFYPGALLVLGNNFNMYVKRCFHKNTDNMERTLNSGILQLTQSKTKEVAL